MIKNDTLPSAAPPLRKGMKTKDNESADRLSGKDVDPRIEAARKIYQFAAKGSTLRKNAHTKVCSLYLTSKAGN